RCVSFFFSSRRRHTRSKRDWSSDVCSSDLGLSVAQAVTEATSIGEILWFGSSNPVRDADLSVPWSVDSAPLVAAHRGLAGIDGKIGRAPWRARARPAGSATSTQTYRTHGDA